MGSSLAMAQPVGGNSESIQETRRSKGAVEHSHPDELAVDVMGACWFPVFWLYAPQVLPGDRLTSFLPEIIKEFRRIRDFEPPLARVIETR